MKFTRSNDLSNEREAKNTGYSGYAFWSRSMFWELRRATIERRATEWQDTARILGLVNLDKLGFCAVDPSRVQGRKRLQPRPTRSVVDQEAFHAPQTTVRTITRWVHKVLNCDAAGCKRHGRQHASTLDLLSEARSVKFPTPSHIQLPPSLW